MITPIHRSPETQAAIQRTLKAAQQLEKDARDMVVWLDAEFPGLVLSLEVQRHYACADDQIAHVEPSVTDRPRRHEVRDAAEKALTAFGWSLCPEGRDVHSAFYRPSKEMSAHARLAAVSRVRQTLGAAETAMITRPHTDTRET